MMNRVNAGARLDRLPIGPFHRRVLWLVGMGMFFDSFDNTLSGSVLAAMLHSQWSTLELNSLFMSATFLGLMIGAALSGWLSDRFGRLFAYQFNLAIFGVMALASAFAPSMHWLIVMRFIMGIGMGAEYVMGYGLIIEFVPPQQRGRYLGLLGIITGAGVFTTSVVGMVTIPTLGWRAMFVIGGVGTLWLWYLRRHLPESPRWLERVGRGAEADAILKRIEAEAGVTEPAVQPARTNSAEPRHVNVSVLFSRPVIRRTLVAVAVNVIVLFGSYTISGWMPTFFVKQGMSVTHSLGFNAAMMGGWVAGPLLCTFIADRLGRRWGVALAAVICAATCMVYPLLTSSVAIITCGFFLVSAVAVALILGLGGTPELFPTEYRFRGAGFAQTAGRLGLIGSPFVILYVFDHYGIGGVITAVSGLYVLVALILAVAGIETNQQSLEDVEPEVELSAQDQLAHPPRAHSKI
ncbi:MULTISPECIES: MFS transporter [unclassified Burkholderia]|uniref:MFS transporter n=1 Tax=unclassified Burkholderia TaxID=2613784 RepID=UPI000F5A5298|nr:MULTISPECIES: MFS transporter [unclassified Burkholderia]RQS24833.1 MFS transporter [Burkholderia sp. Bp8995]RQS43220.1 MFS transporter [Burkholderia sp. Bp8989]